MRYLLTLVVTLSLTGAAALAQVSLSSSINALEMKYFDHTFEGEDTNDARVDRIEKFIFGETSNGTAEQRMNKIMATLASEDALPKPPALPQASAPVPAPQASSGRRVAAAPPAVPSSPAQAADDDPDYDGGAKTSYPHVDALENELLGQAHAGEPLATRLSRLEVAAFGAATPNLDLSTRTDKLENYAEQKLHVKPFGVNPAMSGRPGPEVIEAPPARSPYNVLRSFMPGVPFVNGGGGYPYPTQPPDQDAAAPVYQDPPEVFAKEPPPSGSSMMVKVGWCEMQLFGHTTPNTHLMERLRHLNEFLFPNDTHETGFQLMDRVEIIEKAVIDRKSRPQAQHL